MGYGPTFTLLQMHMDIKNMSVDGGETEKKREGKGRRGEGRETRQEEYKRRVSQNNVLRSSTQSVLQKGLPGWSSALHFDEQPTPTAPTETVQWMCGSTPAHDHF